MVEVYLLKTLYHPTQRGVNIKKSDSIIDLTVENI